MAQNTPVEGTASNETKSAAEAYSGVIEKPGLRRLALSTRPSAVVNARVYFKESLALYREATGHVQKDKVIGGKQSGEQRRNGV